MRVVVIGAGVAGLISRSISPATGTTSCCWSATRRRCRRDADAAFTWDRRGAPQVRHPHAFLGAAAQPAARRPARCAARISIAAGAQRGALGGLRARHAGRPIAAARRRRPGADRLPPHDVRVGAAPRGAAHRARRAARRRQGDGAADGAARARRRASPACRRRAATSRRISSSMRAGGTRRSGRCSATSA